jgi:hypothetical protein
MIDRSVPIRSSLWSGMGTVIVPPAVAFCMTMWLLRCRTRANPCRLRIAHASRPESLRNLPTANLDLGNEDLSAEAFLDFRRGSAFEKQLYRIAEVVPRLFDGAALAGDVQFRAEGDEAIAFTVDYGG